MRAWRYPWGCRWAASCWVILSKGIIHRALELLFVFVCHKVRPMKTFVFAAIAGLLLLVTGAANAAPFTPKPAQGQSLGSDLLQKTHGGTYCPRRRGFRAIEYHCSRSYNGHCCRYVRRGRRVTSSRRRRCRNRYGRWPVRTYYRGRTLVCVF